MHLTLVTPGLAAAAHGVAPVREALARIARLGRIETQASDLDRAIITALQLPDASAVAPLAALGAGFDAGAAYVLRADPVTLIAGRDDVLLAGRVDDLDRAEAAALCATLNAHFGGDGLSFHTPRPDAWFVGATANVPVTTTPLAAIAGPLHDHLPSGPHGNIWRRWLSEMQMLLHEHPVNTAREAAGRMPVTGVWIASGGRLVDVATPVTPAIRATTHAAGDLARGIAIRAGRPASLPPASFAALPAEAALVVLDPARDADAAARVARDWLVPVAAALARGALDTLVVLGDGRGEVQCWAAARASLFTRLRARLAGKSRAP